MKNDIKDIYAEMLEHMHTGTSIPDDVMYMLFIISIGFTEGLEFSEMLTEHAREFCIGISHLWSSKSYASKNYDPAFIFQLGELHGCARMLDKHFSDIATQKHLDEDSKKYLAKLDFFNEIFEHPGIKRSELADKLNMTQYAIDQFDAEIKSRSYLIVRIGAYEKYYYLTNTGVRLLNAMKWEDKQKEEEKND